VAGFVPFGGRTSGIRQGGFPGTVLARSLPVLTELIGTDYVYPQTTDLIPYQFMSINTP